MIKLDRQAIRINIIGLILITFALFYGAFSYFLTDFLNNVEENLGVKLIRQQASITKQRALSYFTNDKSLIDQSLFNQHFQRWMIDPTNATYQAEAIDAIESTCAIIQCEGWFLYSHGTLRGFDWNDTTQIIEDTQIVLERDTWYTDIIATGKPYFIDASVHPFNGNAYVYFDYFVRQKDELIGLVGTYVSTDIAFNSILDYPSEDVSNILLDNNQIVRGIDTSKNSDLHQALVDYVNEKNWQVLLPAHIIDELEKPIPPGSVAPIMVEPLEINGREYISAIVYIEELEWYAVSLLDREILNAKIDTTPFLIIASVILLAMMVITVYVINTQLIDSTMHMLDVVTRVANGSYDEKVKVRKNDELGALGQGINQMTETLSSALVKLENQNDALNNAIFEAEEASLAKSQFLSNMSHELRTPMNAVLGFAQVGIEAKGEHQKNEYLRKIGQSGEHLLSVINDILDFNKIESNTFTLESTSFRINRSLRRVLDMCLVRADEKGLKVKVQLDKAIPKHLIGDPFRLEQILINLLGNAIKFTDDGSVSIKVDLQDKTDNGVTLKIAVTDTGIGIAEAHLAQLFSEFTQADNSITRKYGGTGLGLTITKQLVERMHGNIHVESQLGKGSTFSFTAKFEFSDEPMIEPVKTDNVDPSQLVNALAGKSVLLVEDNEINRLVVERMLEPIALNLDVAVNGEEAVAMVKKNKYGLVLMDVQMPVLDGIDATRAIRQFNTSMAIIGLSAHANTEHTNVALNAGMNDYLTKPVDKDKLFQMLYKFLSG